MFIHEGAERNQRQNRILAGYLASVAGFVNSCGLLLTGVVTSHVTGNVARATRAAAHGESRSVADAASLVVAFFAGALIATLLTESRLLRRTRSAYGAAMACEGALLGLVAFRLGRAPTAAPGMAVWLSLAMGIQNSLVTRLSGAVVRTTHLTGVVTDLAIESARWIRWYAVRVAMALRFRGTDPVERPAISHIGLLFTIVAAFSAGGLLGAIGAVDYQARALWLPVVAIGVGVVYAFSPGHGADVRASRSSRSP